MLKFRSNGRRLADRLSDAGRKQLPFATAVALTRTAKDGAKAVSRRLSKVIDNPRSFTVKAPRSRSATKSRPVATVYIPENARRGVSAAKYLRALEEGAPRRHKGFERALIAAGVMRSNEYAVPARGFRLNKYGNIPGATFKRMLGDVMRQGSGKADGYFAPMSGGLARGVWRRRGKRIAPVLIFVTDRPSYRPIIQFDRTVIEEAGRVFPDHMRVAFREAMANRR